MDEVRNLWPEIKKHLSLSENFSLDFETSIPTLVVVGDQSSGKSSVLSVLACIVLCMGEGQTTSFPLELRFRKGLIESKRLQFFQEGRVVTDKEFNPQDLLDCQNMVMERIRETRFNPNQELVKFFEERIVITLTGKDYDDFTLIDLPGLCQEEYAFDKNPEKVRQMIRREITKPNAIILHVINSCIDMANIQSHLLCNEVDPKKERRISIFTKIDICPDPKGALLGLKNVAGNGPKILMINRCFKNDEWKTLSTEEELTILNSSRYEDYREWQKGRMAAKKELHVQLEISVKRTLPEFKTHCQYLRNLTNNTLMNKIGRVEASTFHACRDWTNKIEKNSETLLKEGVLRVQLNEVYSAENISKIFPEQWDILVDKEVPTIEREMQSLRGDIPLFAMGSAPVIQKFTGRLLTHREPHFVDYLERYKVILLDYLLILFDQEEAAETTKKAMQKAFTELNEGFEKEFAIFYHEMIQIPKNISSRPDLYKDDELQKVILDQRCDIFRKIKEICENSYVTKERDLISEIDKVCSDKLKELQNVEAAQAKQMQEQLLCYWRISAGKLQRRIRDESRDFETIVRNMIKNYVSRFDQTELFAENEEQREIRRKLLGFERILNNGISEIETM